MGIEAELLAMVADPRRWWVLIGVSLAGMLVALDYTVVNICLPTIQSYFGTSTNALQWLMLGFGITFSSCLAGAGKLADILGRRKLLYVSMGLFMVASLGAGLASNMLFLISMRFLQGLSAASIFPSGTAIIASNFPPHERSRVIGMFGSMLGIGLAIGPVIGGLIVSYMSWKWIFFVNVPLSMIALFFCIVLGRLTESKHPTTPPIDWVGTGALIVFIAALCLVLSQATSMGWLSPIVISCLLIAVISFIVLVVNTKKQSHPIIPPDLLINKSFLLGSAVFICTISVSWVVAFYIPLYLREVPHFDIITASLWFCIMTIMTIIAPVIAGVIFDKYSKRMITHLSFLISIIGLIAVAIFTTQTPTWLMIVAFIIFGCAWGAGNGISMPIGLMSVKGHEDAGIVSGVLLTISNATGTLFLAMATSLFNIGETRTIIKTLSDHSISLAASQFHQIKAYLADPERTRQLITSFGHQTADVIINHFQASFMSGFSLIFFVFAIMVAVLYAMSYKSINKILGCK